MLVWRERERESEIELSKLIPFLGMVPANREMVVYCFDILVAHYNSQKSPPPAFEDAYLYFVPPNLSLPGYIFAIDI